MDVVTHSSLRVSGALAPPALRQRPSGREFDKAAARHYVAEL
jgi:hypothetical protein